MWNWLFNVGNPQHEGGGFLTMEMVTDYTGESDRLHSVMISGTNTEV